jgi:peptidoglycan hydrolase-like protein with peptidoglycan-binding domain
MAWTQAVALPAASASKTSTTASHPAPKPKSTKTKSTKGSTSSKGKRSRKASRRGQQKIDLERTHQIQTALIKQHYLSGEPSGKWDASTEAALRKFQADNGWQNKTVPDSRALIKLGLGPNHDHLLNPESAMTSTPETSATSEASTPAPKGPAAPVSQPQQ